MLDGEKAVPEELTDFIELYRLAADYETRNALGAEPLKPYLERIEALDGMDALRENLADLMMAGMPLPFGVTVMADMADASVRSSCRLRTIISMMPPVPRCRAFTARCPRTCW